METKKCVLTNLLLCLHAIPASMAFKREAILDDGATFLDLFPEATLAEFVDFFNSFERYTASGDCETASTSTTTTQQIPHGQSALEPEAEITVQRRNAPSPLLTSKQHGTDVASKSISRAHCGFSLTTAERRATGSGSKRAPTPRARHRRNSSDIVVTISNATYLRRLYMSPKLLRLFKISSTSHEVRQHNVCYHRVSFVDICERAWEAWVETRMDRKHACLAKGWAYFCKRNNVCVHDKVRFMPHKVNSKRCVRAVIHKCDS
jgi:hypothetical protein